jgi:hypothetical protein
MTASPQTIHFTRPDSEKILKLEEEIVYLYGAPEPQKVASHYMQAIKTLEEISATTSEEQLREKTLPFLVNAYAEVKAQTALQFDVLTAASYEYDMISAQSRKAGFEDICAIHVRLYQEIFQSKDPAIEKAAMLRTFLYQYKIRLLSREDHVSNEDISLMKQLAKRSAELLNGL